MVYVVFFFFKQKTAYEMRISDWSSDVCSSDLGLQARRREHRLGRSARQQDDERNAVLSPDSSGQRAISQEAKSAIMDISELITTDGVIARLSASSKKQALQELAKRARSEERRGGKECVSTCRSRW